MQAQGALQRRRGRRSIVVALAAALSLAATCRSRGPGVPGPTPVPAPTLPAPTGPYSVGTLTLEVAPPGRAEPFTDAPEDRRRFVVQLWYPARATRCVPVPYMDAVTAAAVAEELPPDFAARVRVSACGDGPPAAGRGRLPVVLFSHGFGATRFGSTALLSDLASRGFVVVALHHTYGSRITVFPDGTAVEWREEPWAAGDAFLRNAQEWVRDAVDTLDLLGDLERGAAGGARFPLAGRLDLRRLAYVGHSYGGFAAILTARRDQRVRAVVNLDGRMFGDDIPRPVRLQVPLLVLLNEVSPRRADFAHQGTARFAVVRGMPHPGFTDGPLLRAAEGLPPFRHDGMTSVRPAGELATLTREAVGAFLECTLREEPRACAALDAQLERLRGEPAP
jgi:predicted dienelactone hydrolase